MPPSRLLQGSSRQTRPAGGGSRSAGAASGPSDTLPPYEPPVQALNIVGKRALADLSTNRETRRYEAHLVKLTASLRDSVGSINDLLLERRTSLANLAEKRRQRAAANGDSESATRMSTYELQLQEEVAKLEVDVAALTDQTEEALRNVIDCRAELEDEQRVLAGVQERAAAQKERVERPAQAKRKRASKRGQGQESDVDELDDAAEEPEDEEMQDTPAEEPLIGLPELLRTERKAKADEYAALTVHQRYGLNNDYVSFKRTWHDALHPEDQVPLPDASTWFDAQGRPTKAVAPQPDQDDEELVVQREVIDIRCQLSLKIFNEPYTSRICPHTFEKSDILSFLEGQGGAAPCPVCQKVSFAAASHKPYGGSQRHGS